MYKSLIHIEDKDLFVFLTQRSRKKDEFVSYVIFINNCKVIFNKLKGLQCVFKVLSMLVYNFSVCFPILLLWNLSYKLS